MRLLLEDTMALVVDYQEKLLPVIDHSEDLKKRSVILLKGLKALGVPMVMTQQYTRGIGMTVSEIQEAVGSGDYFDKLTFSCFEDEAIRKKILQQGKKTILVCGIEAHICVLQTCIDLKTAGFLPVLVTDCVGSRRESDRQVALMRARSEGILLTTTESVLFELMKKAGSPVFKEISRLIK